MKEKVKLHMVCISSNNDRHSTSLHFTPLHYACRHFTSFHLCFTHYLFTQSTTLYSVTEKQEVFHHHRHHISFTELGHLLTRSGLTYPEVSSKVCHDSFCQLGSNVSLPWVIYYGAFYLHLNSHYCQK